MTDEEQQTIDKLLEMDAGDLVASLQAKGYSYRELSSVTGIHPSSFVHYTRPGPARRKAREEDWRALARFAIQVKAI